MSHSLYHNSNAVKFTAILMSDGTSASFTIPAHHAEFDRTGLVHTLFIGNHLLRYFEISPRIMDITEVIATSLAQFGLAVGESKSKHGQTFWHKAGQISFHTLQNVLKNDKVKSNIHRQMTSLQKNFRGYFNYETFQFSIAEPLYVTFE